MEHATAFVNSDANTPKCSCRKLAAAGWKTNCAACRRVADTVAQTATNVYELRARWAKAGKLADVLVAQGATSAEAAALAHHSRMIVAALAGVRRPSDTTWDLVVGLLAVVEREAEADELEEDDELRFAGV